MPQFYLFPAVFIKLSAGFAKEPVRYQNYPEKTALSTLHPIIAIEPDHTSAELVSMERNRSMCLDNPHTIEIEASGLQIRMSNAVCGRKCDRSKAILEEPDGIVMIYKRLTAHGSYRWSRDKSEVRNLTWREFDWLMSGIDIEQPKAIKTS